MEFFVGLLAIGFCIWSILTIAKLVKPKTPSQYKPDVQELRITSQKNSHDTFLKKQDIEKKENIEREKIYKELSEPFEVASEDQPPHFVFFDLETTGFIPDGIPEKDHIHWPHPVQIAWMVFTYEGELIKEKSAILFQDVEIPEDATKVHRISTEKMKSQGIDPIPVFAEFTADLKSAAMLVAHNMEFDYKILKAEFYRKGLKISSLSSKRFCTMKKSKEYCGIPFPYKSGYKYPKLSELAACCFGGSIDPSRFTIKGGHDALTDVRVTAKCFFHLLHVMEEFQIETE